MNPFHTPAEMIQFSNLAHWFEGGLLGLIAVVGLMQLFGYLGYRRAQYIWSALILVAGAFLVPYLLLHHGLNNFGRSWNYIIHDPQQRQHFIMGILLMLAGTTELLHALNILRAKVWQLVFPIALAIIGILFIVHNQHGTAEAVHQSVIFHRYLGTALILSGVAKAAEVVWRERYRKIGFIWIALMLVTSGMLIMYREPDGAYNAPPSVHQEKQIIEHSEHIPSR